MSQVRPVDTGAVALSQVVTEQQLVEHSEAFENAIVGRDRMALQVREAVPLVGLPCFHSFVVSTCVVTLVCL